MPSRKRAVVDDRQQAVEGLARFAVSHEKPPGSFTVKDAMVRYGWNRSKAYRVIKAAEASGEYEFVWNIIEDGRTAKAYRRLAGVPKLPGGKRKTPA